MEVQSKHIVSIVLNGVAGDSRVIKTAKAAEGAGYRATIVGMSAVDELTSLIVEGVAVVLVPTPLKLLQAEKLWPADKDRRELWLLVEAAVEAITPVVRDLKPDLIHSHDMSGLRVGDAVSRRLAVDGHIIPWVHDIHEYVVGLTTVPETYRRSSMEYERRYLRQADHLITVSDKLADELKAYYHLRDAPTVVYNAPASVGGEQDDPSPDVRSAIGLSPDQKLVIYIGVAKKERGCETIVEAVASLPNVHLCFVSSSGYVELLRAKADELGMGGRFHALPYVASDQVVDFIRTADVGTHGLIHYPNGEVAMPNKMFEYLQAGVPMVVSDVAEMKRFVEANDVGTVFEAENAISCAHAIRTALNKRSHYARSITAQLKNEFSWQSQAAKLEAIYASLLSKPLKRTLVVSDAQSAASVHLSDNERLAVVAQREPEEPCDVYIDPSVNGDQAGLLSKIIGKYGSIRVVGSPQWPSYLDRKALMEIGYDIQFVSPELSSPLQSLEQEYTKIDRAIVGREIAARKLAVKVAPTKAPDATTLLELKAANKKLARLSATVKSQRKTIDQMGAEAARSKSSSEIGKLQVRHLPPSKRLSAAFKKLFAPTRR